MKFRVEKCTNKYGRLDCTRIFNADTNEKIDGIRSISYVEDVENGGRVIIEYYLTPGGHELEVINKTCEDSENENIRI